jgi:haloalkane dehalogenase
MSLDVNLQNEDHHPRQLVKVLDSVMSYVDIGSGSPIIFLHGNPTSSYLWRNIIPYAAELGRCLAPDLIGMGGSSPSPKSSYRFEDHSRYLDAWFDALGIDGNVILVLHDWGSALGFYRAFRRPEQVRAIVYMESILQPRNWSDFTVERGQQFRALRSGEGERMIFDENFAIESIVPASVIRTLSTSEMNAYRAPFAQREARLPTLIWPRELPIEGRPADVTEIVEQYAAWLKDSPIPKLFINGAPGSIIGERARAFCRTWRNQIEVTVKGIHYLQEDSPQEIGAALASFIQNLDH